MSSIFSFIILIINRGFKHRSCFISLFISSSPLRFSHFRDKF